MHRQVYSKLIKICTEMINAKSGQREKNLQAVRWNLILSIIFHF